jgi:soluble cytochrome b562
LPSYALLRELQTLADREEIIRENPNMTKREAAAIKRKRKIPEQDADASLKKYRKGFNAMCTRIAEAASWAESASKLSYAELDEVSQKIERLTFANFGRDVNLLIKYRELMAPFVLDEEAGVEQEAPDTAEHTQPEITSQSGG